MPGIRKDLKRAALMMEGIKNPFRTKTTETVKTSFQGGGLFPENDGYAGIGTKTTFTDRKGRVRKEVIKSSISPENRKQLSGSFREYGDESDLSKSSTRKKVTKSAKNYSKTGVSKTKEVFNTPGDGVVKVKKKTKSLYSFGKETFKDGSKIKVKRKAKGTKSLRKAAKLGEV